MEQLTFIKNKLKINNFPDTRIKGFGFVGSTEIITVSTLIALICSILLGNLNPNYIVVGTILPLFFMYKKVAIVNYW
jgi:hypothetical protein